MCFEISFIFVTVRRKEKAEYSNSKIQNKPFDEIFIEHTFCFNSIFGYGTR
jgi:hypothetical protein